MKTFQLGIAFTLTCVSASLLAQNVPPPELARIAPYIFPGTRDCTSTLFATRYRPQTITTGIAQGELAVGGAWIHFTYDATHTAASPHPYHIGGYIGYDAATKQYVQSIVDLFGHNTSTSNGPVGDTLTFEYSNMEHGKLVHGRDIYGRAGSNAPAHTGKVQDENGRWVKTDEEVCDHVRTAFDAEAESKVLLQRDAEWAAAATAGKDIEKIVSYWSDDAIVVEPGQQIYEGKTAIRAYVADSLHTPGFSIHWVSEKPMFSSDGSMAFMRGVDVMTFPDSNGKLVKLHTRGISVWRRAPGGLWLCVADIANEAPAQDTP